MIHSKQTAIPDDGTSDVGRDEWNDTHIRGVISVSEDTVLTILHDTIIVRVDDRTVTITIPIPGCRIGQQYSIQRPMSDAGVGVCNIVSAGGNKINNEVGYQLINPGQQVTIYTDGIEWHAYGK